MFLGENRREPIDPSTVSHAQLQQQVLGSELEFLCCFLGKYADITADIAADVTAE